MGVSISVDVEGESSIPVNERTDGKLLAQIIGALIRLPKAVGLLGLSSTTTDKLQRVDESAYGIQSERPKDLWQNPRDLKIALEETRKAFQKVRSEPFLVEELESGDYFYTDDLDGYDLGIEDAINICDWAIKRNKRVRLTAW